MSTTSNRPPSAPTSSSSSGGGGGKDSAWSRPLSNSNRSGGNSRFDPVQNRPTSSSGGGGGRGGGGSQGQGGSSMAGRPPPGMDGRSKSSGGGGGWGSSRGGGSGGGQERRDSNGYSGPSAAKRGPSPTPDNDANTSGGNSNILRDRFLHLILSMVGHTVTLTSTSGQVLEGVLHTFTPFDSAALNDEMRNVYILKACRVIKKGDNENGSRHIEEGSTVVVPCGKVASVQVKSMRMDALAINAADPAARSESAGAAAAGGGDPFQTDSQISGGRGGTQSLVAAGSAWTSAGDGGGGGGSKDAGTAPASGAAGGGGAVNRFGGKVKGADALNWRSASASSRSPSDRQIKSAPTSGGVDGNLRGSIGDWDQFSANAKKFNVKASYDENLYTTKLDTTNIDDGKRREAERIAKEIESTVSTNIHVAEERGQKIMVDYDEEDLYSGVLTKDLKAREVPATDNSDTSKQKGGKVMNYAAAASQGKKEEEGIAATAPASGGLTGPIGEMLSKVMVDGEAKDESNKKDAIAATADGGKDGGKTEEEAKKEGGEKKEQFKSKLRAGAKEYSLSATAKSFVPVNPVPAPAPPQQIEVPATQQQQPMGQQYPPGGSIWGWWSSTSSHYGGEYGTWRWSWSSAICAAYAGW